jgi:hypothetical protein
VIGGGIIAPNLELKWGQSISLGEVLYSTKCVKQEPQNTTHNHNTYTHNNQHERPPPCLLSSGLSPPPLHGQGKVFLNHRAAAPLRVCAGREPSGLRSPASGERRGVASAVELIDEKIRRIKYVVALRGRQTTSTTQQPTKNMRAQRGKEGTRCATAGERRGGTI